MATLLAAYNLFAHDPASRLLAGGLFLILQGYLFHRYAGGWKNALFAAAAVLLSILFSFSPAVHLLSFVVLILAFGYLEVGRARTRPRYEPAIARVESGGIKRGLTPPEAAVLLEKPLSIVIGLVLVGLVRKGVVVQLPGDPLVLAVAEPFRARPGDPQDRIGVRREAAQANGVIIHPYEEPFIALLDDKNAKPLQTLNLVAPVRILLQHTARRVQGYNLPETREYYHKHLGRARHDVIHASKNGRGEQIKEQNFEWVLLEDRVMEVYGDAQPDWLLGLWPPGIALIEWTAGLLAAAERSVPADGLKVKGSAGQRLAIGSRDRVTTEVFNAVARNLE